MTSQTHKQWRSDRNNSPSAVVKVVYAMSPTVQAVLVMTAIATAGISAYAVVKASIAERESRLQRLEVDEMKVALQVQGIKIHEGSSP